MSQQVLYIRADPELIRLLDRLVERERQERRGCRVSRSDVVRRLLWEAISAQQDGRAKEGELDVHEDEQAIAEQALDLCGAWRYGRRRP